MEFRFGKRSELKRLEKRYCGLMKKSFQNSARNPQKSRRAHEEAESVHKEIQKLSGKLDRV